MSAPFTDDLVTKFRNILSNLLTHDNDIRSEAEAKYNQISDPEKFYFLLSVLSDDSVQIEIAELAAVLMRRLISSDTGQVFAKMETELQNQIKNQLLSRLQQNINQNLRRKICHVAAELAQVQIDEEGNNHWPDFLKYLFHSANSPDPFVKEIALLMFASVPGVFGNQQSRYLSVIHQMLYESLMEKQTQEVRYVAVKALSNFLLANEKEVQVLKQFGDCFALLLQFFGFVLETDDGQPGEILRYLIDLAEICPNVFRQHLDVLFHICIKSLTNPNYEDSCRNLCVEVIVTLCEAAPVMIKKVAGKHIPGLVSNILKQMAQIEDQPNWDFLDEDNSSDDDSPPVVAEAALDRISCALGGKTVLPIVLNALPILLQSTVWNDRYAGLMAVSAIGEGCHKPMVSMLQHIVEAVLPFLFDQYTRVRYAACNALGQMSSDFGPVFQKKFHEQVVPVLLQILRDPVSPRVRAHAGAALVNFFEEAPKYTITPHLTNIINTFESVLKATLNDLAAAGSKLVLEQIVVTLASLADSAQEKFTDYYERFMPCLKHIITNAIQPDLRLLRGKTIECVSLIGLAVGKEKFMTDAVEVMDLLLQAQNDNGPIADDDPQLSYMIAAWARLCKLLGKGFKPYLPYVMEPVLRTASYKPEIAVLDADDMKSVSADDEWEFVNLGEKHNFGIRTAGLDEKANACQMLVCYARELKDAFCDYAEATVKLMLPLLKFYFHDGVRISAGEILPYLLEGSKVKGEQYVMQMWQFILPALLQAIESEPEIEVVCEQMSALASCIEVLHRPCLQSHDLNTLIKLLNNNLANHFMKSELREAKRLEEDYDEVVEEIISKEDDDDTYLLGKVAEILSALFTVYKKDLFPYFDLLLPHFNRLLEPQRPWSDHQWALCVFSDVIEAGGPDCARYQQYFIEPVLKYVKDKNPDLRQTAAYTIGNIGMYGGPGFAKFCIDTIPLLVEVISAPDSRSEENERATENAISAITKFVLYNTAVKFEDIMPMWLSWLPIWEDEDEVICVFSFLCTLLESNNPVLIGHDNANVPRIVQVIAHLVYKEGIYLRSALGVRLLNLMKEIEKNPRLFSICVSLINPDHLHALNAAMMDVNVTRK